MAVTIDGTTGVSLVQDGVVATADLAANAVTSAKLFSGFANGITEAQMWRLNTTVTVGSTESFLTAWEVVDSSFYQTIGTGLTRSSSIFSFPSTGIYYIAWHGRIHYNSSAQKYLFMELQLTTDNDFSSTNFTISAPIQGGYTSDSYSNLAASALFKISDISNEKFRFRVRSESANTNLQGHTNQSNTGFSVLKLGDI